MSRIEHIGDATLYLGNAREIVPALSPFNSAVTSPPYGDLRDYGGHGKTDLLAVINLLANKLLPGGVIVWNTNDQVIDGSESGESFRQALRAIECGLRLHDTMIYCKEGVTTSTSPVGALSRLTNSPVYSRTKHLSLNKRCLSYEHQLSMPMRREYQCHRQPPDRSQDHQAPAQMPDMQRPVHDLRTKAWGVPRVSKRPEDSMGSGRFAGPGNGL